MKLAGLFGKRSNAGDAGGPTGMSPPPGAEPHADHPPDLAGRRRFLADHIFIHTHVPKTAGSTLSHALSAIVGGAHAMDLRLKRRIWVRDMSTEDKRDLRLIAGHFKYGMHQRFPQKPLYIAALRDPVERAVSYYRFVLGAPKNPHHTLFKELGFEASWDQMEGRAAETRSDEQSRILCGIEADEPLDAGLLQQRADTDYFLLIPSHRVDHALKRLRGAFGMPGTKFPVMNPSQTEEIEVTRSAREKILAANSHDAALVARVENEFDVRLDRAVAYIAHHCLKDDG